MTIHLSDFKGLEDRALVHLQGQLNRVRIGLKPDSPVFDKQELAQAKLIMPNYKGTFDLTDLGKLALRMLED